MWRTIAVALFLLFFGGVEAWASVIVSPSDANISYVGRWGGATVNSTASKVMAGGGGNRFQFRFTGTAMGLNFYFTGHTYAPIIEYRIDGGSYTSLTLVSGTNSITVGLASGTHTAEIWMKGIQENAPRWVNPLAFQGIVLDNGASVSAYPTGAKGRILVLGDSIAEGILVNPDGLSTASYAGQTTCSWGRMSFINQVGSALGLDIWDHSYGGAGFSGVTVGGVPATETNYLYAAGGVSKADPQFDMVLIEVVNNDGGMDDAAFVTAYEALIDQVRIDQGNIPIFCLGPFSPFGGDKSAHVHTAATAKGCIWIDNSSWVYSHPNLDHPDLAGHTAIAGYLAPILQPYVPAVVNTSSRLAANARASSK